MDSAPLKKLDEFLIARGGPFHTLQNQLGLLREESLWAGRRAAIFVGLAWGIIGGGLTPAGWWAFLVSLPIFWFLGRHSAASRGCRIHKASV